MEIVLAIFGKIGECLVAPIGHQCGYLIYHDRNIENFKDHFQKLRDKRDAVQQSVDTAKWNDEAIAGEVQIWLTNAGKKNEDMQRFIADVEVKKMCLNGWCPDMKSRYSLSRKAQKNTEAIIELIKEGDKYDRVYISARRPLEVVSSSTEGFKDFESRKTIIKDVMEALRDHNIHMIAICGYGRDRKN
ncbi:hypothetical protein CJ030_MR3G003308 [Morella rubra]|uniref:Uncharacterized protein n=1 Tax=Morella rubra TaxID=262757 RepID=A0A6A1WAT3_9ROSI|nr:hypothetical protein CJ030_MR3G003308 [Morella rubra]